MLFIYKSYLFKKKAMNPVHLKIYQQHLSILNEGTFDVIGRKMIKIFKAAV